MKVVDTFVVREKKGEVGVEIEVEGTNLPQGDIPYWKCEHDGSLRGEAIEYVLKQPVARDNIPRIMETLNDAFHAADAEAKYTGRAGVHVHINVQQLTMVQVMNFLCLYLTFEEILVNWCGPDRRGNLFCLRGSDADFLISAIRDAARTSSWRGLNTDRLRYASVNVRALASYGSLEFRAMRSTLDSKDIEDWTGFLLRLKDVAQEYDNPQDVVADVSIKGPERMFLDIFGEGSGLNFSYESIMEGVRMAQHIAYAVPDWSMGEYEKFLAELGPIDPKYNFFQEFTELLSSEVKWFKCRDEVDSYTRHYQRWHDRQYGTDRGYDPARPRTIYDDDMEDEYYEEEE
jgi:hypothetical protein